MYQLRSELQGKVAKALKDHSFQFNETLVNSFFSHLFTPDFYQLLQSLLQGKDIWYLRHAETHINKWYEDAANIGSIYPNDKSLYDPSLTLKGREQLTKLLMLQFDIAYVSPHTRTLQTFSNLNIRLRKEPIITPLIKERSRVAAGVTGKLEKDLTLSYPHYDFKLISGRKYWWRHDYKQQVDMPLERESNLSLRCRLALFLLWALLEGSRRILIVSHSAFYEIIHRCEYFQLPKNAQLIRLQHQQIVGFFRHLQKKISTKL